MRMNKKKYGLTFILLFLLILNSCAHQNGQKKKTYLDSEKVYSHIKSFFKLPSRRPASIEVEIKDRESLQGTNCPLKETERFLTITNFEETATRTIGIMVDQLANAIPEYRGKVKKVIRMTLNKMEFSKIMNLSALNFYCQNFSKKEIILLTKVKGNPVYRKFEEITPYALKDFLPFFMGYIKYISDNPSKFNNRLLGRKQAWPFDYFKELNQKVSSISKNKKNYSNLKILFSEQQAIFKRNQMDKIIKGIIFQWKIDNPKTKEIYIKELHKLFKSKMVLDFMINYVAKNFNSSDIEWLTKYSITDLGKKEKRLQPKFSQIVSRITLVKMQIVEKELKNYIKKLIKDEKNDPII